MSRFTGRDLVRVVTAVNNNETADYLTWRFINKVAIRNMVAYIEELYDDSDEGQTEFERAFESYLEHFDRFVEISERLLGSVPIAGPILAIVSALYREVRHG